MKPISGDKANRALALILDNDVDIAILRRCQNVVSYNTQSYGKRLSQEDFDFLKGVVM